MARRLFKKPFGPSERKWNILSLGTTKAVTCELCGTKWPALKEHEDGYTLFRFLGIRGVEQCCGHVLDIIYEEAGEEIAIAFSRDSAKEPDNPKFHIFRKVLSEILPLKASAKLA
jgi:hypothetical protein